MEAEYDAGVVHFVEQQEQDEVEEYDEEEGQEVIQKKFKTMLKVFVLYRFLLLMQGSCLRKFSRSPSGFQH